MATGNGSEDQALARAERVSGRRTIRRVIPYLWPADAPWVRRRVVLSLGLLIIAKLVSVSTPFFFKAAVDSLSGVQRDDGWLLALGAVGLTVAYGVARFLNTGFSELRDVVFARVGVRALHALAMETFRHIHGLSLRYHLQRRTGALSRVMERGVKGVDFLLRFLLFSVGPLMLELLLVGAVLFWLFDIWYLIVVAVTIALYIWYTTAITEWRVRQRKEMNDRDNEANQKAVDSLLNFETVKYFNAEGREASRYDVAMDGYRRAALRTAWSLSLLNAGQGLIITAGIVIVMVMAARGVMAGAHGADHRAPALHRCGCRPHPGDRRRPRGGAGPAWRASVPGRPLCGDVGAPIARGGGLTRGGDRARNARGLSPAAASR